MNVEIMIYLFMGAAFCFALVLIRHIKSAEKAGLAEHSRVSSANSDSEAYESYADKHRSYVLPRTGFTMGER